MFRVFSWFIALAIFALHCAGSVRSGSALILETRVERIDALLYAALSSLPFLPNDWPLVLHTPVSFGPRLHNSSALRYAIKNRRVLVDHSMQLHERTFTRNAYQRTFSSPEFWEKHTFGEHVLIMQTDTCFCASSSASVDMFTSYDYIGAPWQHSVEGGVGFVRWTPHAGNGGFSLRRRSAMINVTRQYSAQRPQSMPEDVFFQVYGSRAQLRFAHPDIARSFSVEHVFSEAAPVGLHKAFQRWPAERRERLFSWCPHARALP